MATISARRIDPILLTGCFNKMGSLVTGGNTRAPAPQGPGFPRQEPSVKTTAVSASQLSRIPPIMYHDLSSYLRKQGRPGSDAA